MGSMNRTFVVQETTLDVYVYGRNVHSYKQMNEFAVSCAATWKELSNFTA